MPPIPSERAIIGCKANLKKRRSGNVYCVCKSFEQRRKGQIEFLPDSTQDMKKRSVAWLRAISCIDIRNVKKCLGIVQNTLVFAVNTLFLVAKATTRLHLTTYQRYFHTKLQNLNKSVNREQGFSQSEMQKLVPMTL